MYLGFLSGDRCFISWVWYHVLSSDQYAFFFFMKYKSREGIDKIISLVFRSLCTNVLYDLNNEICLSRILYDLVISNLQLSPLFRFSYMAKLGDLLQLWIPYITLLLWSAWYYKLCGLTQWCALLWPFRLMFLTREVLCFICFFSLTVSFPINSYLSELHILLLEVSLFSSVFVYTLKFLLLQQLIPTKKKNVN